MATAPDEIAAAQLRIARPTAELAAVRSFYVEAVGLPVVAEWEDHDGYAGVVVGLPDASRQLELLAADVTPTPTNEDQLVLYLRSPDAVAALARRIEASGHRPRPAANPYWQETGATCFVDPDGYWLVLSPLDWS